MSPSNPSKPGVGCVDLSLSGVERVQNFYLKIIDGEGGYNGFGKDLVKNDLKLISAVPGEVVYEMIVGEVHCNRLGSMHGGCVAFIFDVCTGGALIPGARVGYWQYVGVTRNLNVTYLRPALVGTKIIITGTVVHAGRQLATVRGTIANEDGKILSTAEHLIFDISTIGKL